MMVSLDRMGERVILRLLEFVSVTDDGVVSCTAELNVPNSSSTDAVGACLVTLDDMFVDRLYVGGG